MEVASVEHEANTHLPPIRSLMKNQKALMTLDDFPLDAMLVKETYHAS